MSAFILSEDGFKQLASELAYHVNYDHQNLQWAVTRFFGEDRAGISKELIAKRVQELYEANVSAVNQRYGEQTAAPDLGIHTNGAMPRWSSIQLLKNLKCLSYQMAEGDVPDSQVYQDLERLIGDVACAIVGHSKGYEEAKWGW